MSVFVNRRTLTPTTKRQKKKCMKNMDNNRRVMLCFEPKSYQCVCGYKKDDSSIYFMHNDNPSEGTCHLTTVISSLSNHCSLSSARGHISGRRAVFVRLTQRRDSNSPGDPATLVLSFTYEQAGEEVWCHYHY